MAKPKRNQLRLVTTGLTADRKTRIVSGLLLPFGEDGHTNLGTIRASADSGLTIAEDIRANLEHDRTRPAGRMVSSDLGDEGISVATRVAATTAGDDLLAEIEEGLRTGLSVEIDDPVIRDGNLVGGHISAYAFVTDPAFPSAQLVASDVGYLPDEDDDEDDDDSQGEDNPGDDADGDDEADGEDEADGDDDAEDGVEAATLDVSRDTTLGDLIDAVASDEAPADTPGASAVSRPVTAARPAKLTKTATRKPSIPTVAEFTERVTAAMKAGDRRLIAALNDITQGGVGADVSAQAFLGELWSGKGYTRRFVPLMDPGTLTAYTGKGWRWVTKPEVYDYAGNKAAITSEDVDTEPADYTAARLAGGNDIDRKFVDFPDEGFIASYVQALRDSYAMKTDAKALAFLEANATAFSAGSVPSGVNAATAALVDGALAVVDKGTPTFAIMGNAAYRSLLLTPKDSVLEFLSMSLGLDEGQLDGFQVVPGGSGLGDADVIVGIRQAATFYELPGVPIRVDAIDLEHGGVDIGLFGYWATLLNDADALVKTQPAIGTGTINAGADYAMTVGDPDGTNDAGDTAPVVLATFPDGQVYDVTDDAVLTSGTPAKATIVNNKVHAVAAGTSVITATYQGKTDTVTVTVS